MNLGRGSFAIPDVRVVSPARQRVGRNFAAAAWTVTRPTYFANRPESTAQGLIAQEARKHGCECRPIPIRPMVGPAVAGSTPARRIVRSADVWISLDDSDGGPPGRHGVGRAFAMTPAAGKRGTQAFNLASPIPDGPRGSETDTPQSVPPSGAAPGPDLLPPPSQRRSCDGYSGAPASDPVADRVGGRQPSVDAPAVHGRWGLVLLLLCWCTFAGLAVASCAETWINALNPQ